jgi:hypothetical protein
MDPAAAYRWLEGWALGWATHDVDLIASLYVEGPVQRSEPFREADEPARYAAWAFADEERAEVWFAEPSVTGADSAACEWWAISTGADGSIVTLAGVSLLRFAPDGRVEDQRDYWSQRAGAHRPWPGWGPAAAHHGNSD